jgi:hypothetical protein
VTDSSHPVDGRFRGYYLDLVPGYRERLVMAQNSRYDRFPLAANNMGIIHHILDMAPPLLADEEGPAT